MIVDSHVHLIHPEDLLMVLDNSGVKKAFVIPTIRKGIDKAARYNDVKQVLKQQGSKLKQTSKPDNTLVLKVARENDRLLPLAWINPLSQDAKEESDSCLSRGALGIKLQPGFHGYSPSDPRVMSVVETAQDFSAPVFIHTGADSPPHLSLPLIERFPDTCFILMHMGMYTHYTDAINIAKKHENVYLDTADPLPPIAVEIAYEEIGPEKILMGSDFPFWGHPKIAFEKIKLAVNDKGDREKIMGKNALKLVGKK